MVSPYDIAVKLRIEDPSAARRELQRRRRPSHKRSRVLILAVDHTARMSFSVGDDKYAMLNREELLRRVVEAARSGAIDGILASPDLFDDLLYYSAYLRESTGEGLLDGVMLIGTVNRGGLAGAAFELDDRVTAYTPDDIRRLGLDGAKVLLRIDVGSRDTANTIAYVADVARRCAELGVPLMVEVFPVKWDGTSYRFSGDPYELAGAVNVAAGLGWDTTGYVLKVPYVRDFKLVARSTTLPILLLGGGSGNLERFAEELADALRAGPNVVGAVVGRNILFPRGGTPGDAAKLVREIIDSVS